MKHEKVHGETHGVNELKERLKEALHEDDPIKASRAARELFQQQNNGGTGERHSPDSEDR